MPRQVLNCFVLICLFLFEFREKAAGNGGLALQTCPLKGRNTLQPSIAIQQKRKFIAG